MLLQRKGMAGAINQAKNSEFGKSQTPRLESTIDLLNGGSINLTSKIAFVQPKNSETSKPH